MTIIIQITPTFSWILRSLPHTQFFHHLFFPFHFTHRVFSILNITHTHTIVHHYCETRQWMQCCFCFQFFLLLFFTFPYFFIFTIFFFHVTQLESYQKCASLNITKNSSNWKDSIVCTAEWLRRLPHFFSLSLPSSPLYQYFLMQILFAILSLWILFFALA